VGKALKEMTGAYSLWDAAGFDLCCCLFFAVYVTVPQRLEELERSQEELEERLMLSS
jgi:hypothetical protein